MKILVLLGILAVLLTLLEGALRLGYGFGNPPLYVADDHIGYMLAPNQRLKRFGNLIAINEYGMRADTISPLPSENTLRLFLLGDSLANGNWWTDQNDILSVQVAQHVRPALPAPYEYIEPINASANSWGPRNELAYLQRYGTFGAQVLVLLLNTDDLFGTQPTPIQVGRDRSYPNQKPMLAMTEILARFQKQPPVPGLKAVQSEGGDRVGKNLAAINSIQKHASATGSLFILVLSPLKRELPGPRDYELTARQRLQDWARDTNVVYIDLLSTYRNYLPDPEQLYRDHIHLSPAGNHLLAQKVAVAINTHINRSYLQ
ncbi:MAG: SGNH/GDSL hydrolase family protein [Cyanobacteria bacterium P01_D01_bin.105]